MISRRQFLKVGLAGSICLAAAGRFRSALADARTAENGTVREQILRAIIPVMLAGNLPDEKKALRLAVESTVAGVEQAISGLHPMSQKELDELFALLGFGPTRWLLTGISTAWTEASPGEVARFLARWRHSIWALPQAGYQAFHQLIIAAWYSQPRAWASIGYDGPPTLE